MQKKIINILRIAPTKIKAGLNMFRYPLLVPIESIQLSYVRPLKKTILWRMKMPWLINCPTSQSYLIEIVMEYI